jgi:catalase
MPSPRKPLRYNDAPEQKPADEEQDIARILESKYYSLQKRDNGRPRESDVLVKTHGFALGRFEVFSLSEPYCQGLFKNAGGTYDALVRFSSASDVHEKDSAPDGRGMAVKLFGVPGARLILDEAPEQNRTAKTQDFVMINHPVFFSRNAKDYAGIEELLRTHGKPFALPIGTFIPKQTITS